MRGRSSRWQPLPDGLKPGERELFVELRRLVDAAGLTYRELERKTSTVRTDSVDSAFYSKSQWARWLNGQAMPPRRALRRLTDLLAEEDLPSEQVLLLWERAAVTTQPGAVPGAENAAGRDAGDDLAVPPRQLPAVTPHFTGRSAELARLEEAAARAAAGGPAEVVVIAGTAGVGKTTLAHFFCQRVAARFPDGQLHVNLRGFDPGGQPLDASAALRGFLEGLGVKPESVRDDIDAQAALYRTLVAGRRLLIVLDNAAGVDQVRQLIPGSAGCLVVVTSRNELSGLLAQGAQILPLSPFTGEEALRLLVRRLGAGRVQREQEAAEELVRLCARLPLAISVAAAYAAAHPSFPLTALADELRSRGLDQLDTGDQETSARTVFSWSYHYLPDPAKLLFRLLGVHPGPDIGVDAAASLAALPAGTARGALRELGRAYLADEHAPGRFAVHDLLRAYAAELAAAVDGDDSVSAAELRLLDHYLHTGHAAALLLVRATDFGDLGPPAPGVVAGARPGTAEEATAWFTAESLALLGACARAAERDLAPHSWQLAWVVAPFLITQGRWIDAAAVQRAAVAAAERGGDLRGLGHAHYHLAHALDLTGDGDAVEPHLRQALDAFTRTGDQLGRGLVLYGLARALEEQGRHEEALPVAREALRLRAEHGTPAAVASSENLVGAISARLGLHAEAVEHCQRSLRLSEEAGLDLYRGEALYYLGLAHFRAGDHAAAAGSYRSAAEAFRELGDMPDAASALTLLAGAEEAGGDGAAARGHRAEAEATLDGMPPADARQVRAWIERETPPPAPAAH
jgi:tetratricopeptide (TPR) repeat protein/transcriptional regulator with XRE-family HTH domain